MGLATAVSRVKVAGRPAPVPVKSKVAVPPTLCFSMSSEAWVFVNMQVGVSLASMTARTVVSPGSKSAVAAWRAKPAPLPVPMVMSAPFGGAGDVRERPAGLGRLLDVLGPELGGGEREAGRWPWGW